MDYIIIILLGIAIVAQIIMVIRQSAAKSEDGGIREYINTSISNIGGILSENQKSIGELQTENLKNINANISDRLMLLEKRFGTLENTNSERMLHMQEAVEERLIHIEKSNAEKLDSMRDVVDEKLQKTLERKMNESFVLVNDRLKQVYEGLGEMKNLAAGVGDLKKVLSNVKTRGIIGEIQLGAILEQILAPEQYQQNAVPIPGSRNVVEYAIKLPSGDNQYIYLPIDSKFPLDAYDKLRTAYDNADANEIKVAKTELISRIKLFAKDIHSKYIEPPYTTDFAIMFLPSEGLYAEAVNCGLVELLQHDYKVNIAGPSTMAALLNSLQLGFKTLAIQKRSAEVWEVLGAVKTEFDKFGDILEKTQSRLNQINTDLDKLVGTRTNAIKRRLRDVEKLDDERAKELIDKE